MTPTGFAAVPPRPRHRGRPLSANVSLADVVPEVDWLSRERAQSARGAVRAATIAVRRGLWEATGDAGEHNATGFVIADGAILRRVIVGHREGAELLGAGDLVQPIVESEGDVQWRAVADTTLAVIDARVMTDAGAYPELLTALLTAATTRTNTVARQLVMAQWSSADDRLVATFRVLADRWGVVTPDGIALPSFLTHAVLAPLVGARRPSVTTALKRLATSGRVQRAADGRWIVAHAT